MSGKTKLTALELVNQSKVKSPKATRTVTKPREPQPAPARLHPVQAQIWDEIIAVVELRDCDLFLLETLVCLMDQQRTLQRAVDKDGPIIDQSNGRPMHNPAATALRQIEPQLTRCFKELGMSPATRARLKMDNRTKCGQQNDESYWAEF